MDLSATGKPVMTHEDPQVRVGVLESAERSVGPFGMRRGL